MMHSNRAPHRDKRIPHDAVSSRPADSSSESTASEKQQAASPLPPDSGSGRRRREQVGTLGLAATSIAMLAGSASGGATADVAKAQSSDAVTPPADHAEEKAVTWDLHQSDHERIDFFVDFLMGKNYDKTRTWLERTGRYAPMIQNELRERGMPEDLLYLTMIESGLNPNAYSRAHAAGLWQFIEETGERYGLEVSEYVDQRRDPVASTAAALTYLQQMHDRFDSWYLSAAGYNTGENRVGRLMREITGSESGPEDSYWTIWDQLPSETRDYVPLMLAMGRIAKEPGKYGFHDLQYQDPLSFDELTVPGGTKLSDLARQLNVEPSALEDLNPHLIKKQTPPDREMAVRVPVGAKVA
jgi:membrane-bound lytic murein transglycosylase D